MFWAIASLSTQPGVQYCVPEDCVPEDYSIAAALDGVV